MCMSVLCVLLHVQIEGDFSLYLVRLMISFKFMLCSLTPWRISNEDEWFQGNDQIGTLLIMYRVSVLSFCIHKNTVFPQMRHWWRIDQNCGVIIL